MADQTLELLDRGIAAAKNGNTSGARFLLDGQSGDVRFKEPTQSLAGWLAWLRARLGR